MKDERLNERTIIELVTEDREKKRTKKVETEKANKEKRRVEKRKGNIKSASVNGKRQRVQ